MIEERDYQNECVEKACNGNWLIVLGTALGKTVIAAKIIEKTFEKGKKILLLAPTTVLVEQHVKSMTRDCPGKVVNMLTGDIDPKKRELLWALSDIVAATPQTIESDIKNERYNLESVDRILFDEAHHGVGDYSYVFVAANAPNAITTGFTASPGDNLEELKTLLRFEHVFHRSDESEDIKKYIHKVDPELVLLNVPVEYAQIDEFLMIGAWCCALKIGRMLFGKFVLDQETEEMKKDNQHYSYEEIMKFWKKDFEKPFKKFAAPNKKEAIAVLNSAAGAGLWPVVTQASILMNYLHSRNLLLTQDIEVLYHYISKMPENAKYTRNQKSFWLQCTNIMEKLKNTKHIRHPKLYEVKARIIEELEADPKAKIIVFSHFRPSAVLISERLNEFGIKASHFIGKTSGKGIKGMSRKVQQNLLAEFKEGIDVLVATQVAEEGLDIAEVKLVIFYEPADNTIRYIQRKGRTGRKDEGRVIFLVAKGTSDQAIYWSTMNKYKKEKRNLDRVSG